MPGVTMIEACAIAFVAVFALLGALAAVMLVIMLVFRERKPRIDGAVVAAISTTVASLIPGAKVVRIEEES